MYVHIAGCGELIGQTMIRRESKKSEMGTMQWLLDEVDKVTS